MTRTHLNGCLAVWLASDCKILCAAGVAVPRRVGTDRWTHRSPRRRPGKVRPAGKGQGSLGAAIDVRLFKSALPNFTWPPSRPKRDDAAGRADQRPARSQSTLAFRLVTRYTRHALRMEKSMAAPAERMKMMRQRRRARGLRELRLVVADPRSPAVRRRVAKQVAGLDLDRERDALKWVESVSEFDADATR
jgi:hypothetical protein